MVAVLTLFNFKRKLPGCSARTIVNFFNLAIWQKFQSNEIIWLFA